jgi:hypothetical protein
MLAAFDRPRRVDGARAVASSSRARVSRSMTESADDPTA